MQELIKFVMMHGGSRHLNVVDSVIANALYSGPDLLDAFSQEDVEDVSSLYLQVTIPLFIFIFLIFINYNVFPS